jgi:hypothetical protein
MSLSDGRRADGLRRPRPGRSLWRISGEWWAVATVLGVVIGMLLLVLWVWGDARVGGADYRLRDLVRDGSDAVLKFGAVIVGLIAIYRYWYHRYEPLVYKVSCGIIPRPLVRQIVESSARARRLPIRTPFDTLDDSQVQRFHQTAVIVLQESDLEALGIASGAEVDLEFETPEGRKIWAVAHAFVFPRDDVYANWPTALSMSLRGLFRIERPFPGPPDMVGEPFVPDGWQLVEINNRDLARLTGTTQRGRSNAVIVRKEYGVRFRSRDGEFHARDDLEADRGRILEYVGISLRVYRRNALRYRR